MSIEGQQEGPSGDRNTVYLNWTDVNILVLTLFHGSAGYYHWEKLGKGDTGSLAFPTITWESTIISN